MDKKKCKCCGKVLPVTEFYKHPTNKDGLFSICKKCKSYQSRAYFLRKKEANNPRQWTVSAVDCLLSKFNCKDCFIFKYYETPCLMKYEVLGLVRKYGMPLEWQEPTIIEE